MTNAYEPGKFAKALQKKMGSTKLGDMPHVKGKALGKAVGEEMKPHTTKVERADD